MSPLRETHRAGAIGSCCAHGNLHAPPKAGDGDQRPEPGAASANRCSGRVGKQVQRQDQQTCYDQAGTVIDCTGTGQDGDIQPGVAWPEPRFVDNSDGTVTDMLTGLVWLTDASCNDLAGTDASGYADWTTAFSAAAALADGTCGLTDGSVAGDWHLPSVNELQSLIDYEYYIPALSNAAGSGQWTEGDIFVGVLSTYYWASTFRPYNPPQAGIVGLYVGRVTYYDPDLPPPCVAGARRTVS